MKRKNHLSLIVAIVLIVIAGVLIWNNRYLTTIRGEGADFRVWDTASVTKMFLADRYEHESILERHDGGWTLNDSYKAHPKKIDQILYTMNKVRIRMPVSVASHDNIVKQMAGRSTKVEVYQNVPRINLFNKVKLWYHEKKTKVFYVGESTQDNAGTFMLKEGADNAYIVYIPGFRGFISTRFSANPVDWRDHTVFHESLSDIQSVSIEFGDDPQQGFRIDNTGKHQYKLTRLADQQEIAFDTLKVINLLTSFSDVRFEALLTTVLPQERIDSIVHSPFQHRITLMGKDGKAQEVKTFKKRFEASANQFNPDETDEDTYLDNDRMYGLIDNGKDFVLLQYYVFDKLLNGVSYYQAGNPIQYEIEHYQVIE